jgi:hypothetical protein
MVGAQQVGWKFKVNKVRLQFTMVSILVGQHFIINTWLLSISIYQTQLSIIHNQHKLKPLEQIPSTWSSTSWANHLSIPLKQNRSQFIPSSSSIIMWGSRLLIIPSTTDISILQSEEVVQLHPQAMYPSSLGLQVMYSLPMWISRDPLWGFQRIHLVQNNLLSFLGQCGGPLGEIP